MQRKHSYAMSLALLLTLAITNATTDGATVDENRKELERAVVAAFSSHYLTKYVSLEDNDLWLSVELEGKTWRNPKDTRSLVDSIVVLAEQNVPLTKRTFPFKIYIDEPISGLPVADIHVSLSGEVSLKYTYSSNRQKGKKKVYGSRVRRKASISRYDAILSVPNTSSVLIAVDEDAYRKFLRASTRGDYDLLTRLMLSGKLIETGNNIKINIVEYGTVKHKVKILEGMNTGSIGWVAMEFVKK